MHQLIYYKVKNNRTGKSVKLECRVELMDSLSKPITFIVDREKLKIVLGRSSSVFGQKLAKSGLLVQKMRAPEGLHTNTVLNKLKKEFGIRFTVTVTYHSRLTIGNMPISKKKIGGRGQSVKKAAVGKKSGARKSVKKKQSEKFSNIAGGNKSTKNIKFDLEDFKGLGGITEALDQTLDYAVPLDKEDSFDTVEVLFATDRNKTGSSKPNEIFGNNRSSANKLEYGVCKVSIPPEHEEGKIERPSWFDRLLFNDPENSLKHIMIYDLQTKDESDFLSYLSSKITSSTNKDAFIFIHGFNVSFQEAVRRTAQIAHDLSFKGAPISYSWPSLSQKRGYMSDEDSVIWTVPHLKQLIKKILSDTSLVKLHLIAHSMGNRALTNAIKELKAEGGNLEKINQIILAAPDIDSSIFTDVIVPGIKGISKQITLYASSKDKALKVSHIVRSGKRRAGESGDNIIVLDGVSTVDASKVDTDFLGHGYFAETQTLIKDIFLILEHSFTPSERNLKQQKLPPKGIYWLFPA